MTFGNRPEHDAGDALAETTREIRPGRTDWSQRVEEVGDDKLGDRPITNGRQNVCLERMDPVRWVARTAPLRTPQRINPAGRLGKRRNGLAPTNLERVVAGTDRTAVGKRRFTGHTKRNAGITPKTEGAAATSDSDTLRPVPTAARAHAQIEPVPVVVLAGADNGVDEQGAQARTRRRHGKRSPNSPPTKRRKAQRIRGRGTTVPDGSTDRKLLTGNEFQGRRSGLAELGGHTVRFLPPGPGGGDRGAARGAQRAERDADGLGQVAVLPGAGAGRGRSHGGGVPAGGADA